MVVESLTKNLSPTLNPEPPDVRLTSPKWFNNLTLTSFVWSCESLNSTSLLGTSKPPKSESGFLVRYKVRTVLLFFVTPVNVPSNTVSIFVEASLSTVSLSKRIVDNS